MSKGPWAHWRGLLVGTLVGFGAGAVFGGSKLVRVYDWETEWLLDAPLASVYKILTTPEDQKYWWPSMIVQSVTPLAETPNGYCIEYRVKQAESVARFAPPFKITAVTADIEKERRLRTVVTGDLVGVLETLFYSRSHGGTRIVYHWYVRVHHPILNILGFVAAPMFQASHDHVMKEGEAGLQHYCQEQIAIGEVR